MRIRIEAVILRIGKHDVAIVTMLGDMLRLTR
jgi:hypothetical protein